MGTYDKILDEYRQSDFPVSVPGSYSVAPPSSITASVYYTGGDPFTSPLTADGSTFKFRIYTFKSINGEIIYSSTYAESAPVSDDGSGAAIQVNLSWPSVGGLYYHTDGYKILVYDSVHNINFDRALPIVLAGDSTTSSYSYPPYLNPGVVPNTIGSINIYFDSNGVLQCDTGINFPGGERNRVVTYDVYHNKMQWTANPSVDSINLEGDGISIKWLADLSTEYVSILRFGQDPNTGYIGPYVRWDPTIQAIDFTGGGGIVDGKIKASLIANSFKFSTGAGSGKILSSDGSGNASWIDGGTQFFKLNQTSQQTIIGDFSSLPTAYGVKLVPTLGALGTTYGFYSDIPGSHFEFEKNYGGYFKARNAEHSYGIWAEASGASIENWAGWFQGNEKITNTLTIGDPSTVDGQINLYSGADGDYQQIVAGDGSTYFNKVVEASGFYGYGTGISYVYGQFQAVDFFASPTSDISSTSFNIFQFGDDSLGYYSGSPLRFYWDNDQQYLWFDDGALNRMTLSTNVISDFVNSSSFMGGSFSGTTGSFYPNSNITSVPLTVQSCSASANVGVSFDSKGTQTCTISVASPAVITTPVNHGLVENDFVTFTTTGTLPTGMTLNTHYYARNPSGTTFNISTSPGPGGALINTSLAGSGTHTFRHYVKVTSVSPHGRSIDDPIIFGGGTPLPTGLVAGVTYYVGSAYFTSTSFGVKAGLNSGAANYITTTSSGSGAPFVYGGISDLYRIYNSAGSLLDYFDKYGNLYGNLNTTPWRIGVIPIDSNYSGIWFSTAATSPSSSNYSFLGDVSSTFLNGPTNLYLRTANSTRVTITSGSVTLQDATDLCFQTTTGSKIGLYTTQKFAFWGATPIVQPTTGVASSSFTANSGTAVNDASTFDGYTLKQIVKALRNTGLLA